ncbi:venom carboxylesterase-6-like isoform X2 [Toxorhynchites rutilus septentrionalis]|uniref:venom carboxylesterase-6-like isoform X2 n=1 Tax=Toxorhynchites rutilus septentrionalis TaxID=329112 RepID=UPI002479A7EA|nr:venom carboxylesterase-6-like isoform X2 [Toxorhynchites rutilus septentrionalis]
MYVFVVLFLWKWKLEANQDPVPLLFNGSADFLQVSGPCMQTLVWSEDVTGDEDCLYLNIYTVHTGVGKKPRPLLPVLVWIHGGSFVEGSSETDIFGPEFILDENVIVVTFNYRLASFGFLGIDELQIAPNLGLKDQTEALHWVHRNIRSFGGNRNRITLLGWSAGAASVTYHMYTKHSKGLFQRAIAMSGTMTQPWAYLFNDQWCSNEYLKQTDAFSKDELQSRSAKLLIPTDGLKVTYFSNVYLCYIPRRDTVYALRSPYQAVQTHPVSDVPLLIGSTSIEHENIYPLRDFRMTHFNYPNSNVTVYEKIKQYLEQSRGNISAEIFYSRLVSIADIKFGIQYFIEEASNNFKSPIYRYCFSFHGPFGYASNEYYKFAPTIPGAMHGDDLGYLFTPYNYENLVASDEINDPLVKKSLKVQRRMVRMWTSFIRSGNPTPNNGKINRTIWHPYNDGDPLLARHYLSIDRRFRVVRDMRPENYYYQLWRTIFNCLYFFQCEFLDAEEGDDNNGV